MQKNLQHNGNSHLKSPTQELAGNANLFVLAPMVSLTGCAAIVGRAPAAVKHRPFNRAAEGTGAALEYEREPQLQGHIGWYRI